MLISKGAALNFRNSSILDTPLSNVNITFDIIKLLIENGADCKLGAPIYKLCKTNYSVEIMKLLIDNGANANAFISLPSSSSNTIITPLALLSIPYMNSKFLLSYLNIKLPIKNYENSFEIFKLLIENGADMNKIINIFERVKGSPFSFIIQDGIDPNYTETIEIVKFMLSKGANPNIPYEDEEQKLKTYPICSFCRTPTYDHEILKLLVESNANTNVIRESDILQESPLVLLAENQNAQLSDFKLLLEHGANPNQICRFYDKQKTALSTILDQRMPNLDILNILLEHGAEIPTLIIINDYPRTIKDLLYKYYLKNKRASL